MPCCEAYGLLPGRGADWPGLAPPGLGASERGAGAALERGVADAEESVGSWEPEVCAGAACSEAGAAFAAGFGEPGADGAGFAAPDSGLEWVRPPGLGPDAAGLRAPCEGAACAELPRPAAGLDWFALSPPAGKAERSFLATGGSTVEEAPRTNSPSS